MEIWKKNSQIFNLKSDFFLIFQKKHQKTRKFRKFICPELHLSQFSAKLKNLLRSVGREGAHYHRLRGGCQERGVVVRGTARARLAFLQNISPFFLPFFFFSFLFFSFLFSFLYLSIFGFSFFSFLFLEGTARARLAGLAF